MPCVLKLEYGSSAVGVKMVRDKADAVATYKMITTELTSEEDHPGIGLGHGNDMMVMDYISGTEHDIDIVIFKRKLVAAYVSDNGPTRPGSFTETAACMPSCLPEDKVGQLITAAYQCCTGIGLVNGVFNVEMKMTQTGPKLIEINARMGGFYLRDWIKTCYDVDLLLCSFMIFCGIRPVIPLNKPRCQLMGIICVPSVHHKTLTNPRIQALIGILVKQGLVRYNPIEEGMEVSKEFEEPCCSIAVSAENVQKARIALLEMCKVLNISTPEYDVASFLRDFTYHIPLPLLVS
jgi:carnosine synthase